MAPVGKEASPVTADLEEEVCQRVGSTTSEHGVGKRPLCSVCPQCSTHASPVKEAEANRSIVWEVFPVWGSQGQD